MRRAAPRPADVDHTPGGPAPAPEPKETVGVPLRGAIGESGAPNSAAAVEGATPVAAAAVEDGDRGRVGGVDTRGASTVLAEEASACTPAAMAW